MTPWAWSWKEPTDDTYGFECASREAVIDEALKHLKPGDAFEIIEARMSEDRQYEGSDYVPFLRSRNHEVFTISADGKPISERDPS